MVEAGRLVRATAAMTIVFGCGHVVGLAPGHEMPHACPVCVLKQDIPLRRGRVVET